MNALFSGGRVVLKVRGLKEMELKEMEVVIWELCGLSIWHHFYPLCLLTVDSMLLYTLANMSFQI